MVPLLAAESRPCQMQGKFRFQFAAKLLLKSEGILQMVEKAFHSIKQMLCGKLHPSEAGGYEREL